jgi:hypothetical protein
MSVNGFTRVRNHKSPVYLRFTYTQLFILLIISSLRQPTNLLVASIPHKFHPLILLVNFLSYDYRIYVRIEVGMQKN